MRRDKIKSQEELITKALSNSFHNIAIANERIQRYQSAKKRGNKKLCALEWTRQNYLLQKKIRLLESHVEAWSQITNLDENLNLELHNETRIGATEDDIDPISLEEQIVVIRNKFLCNDEKISPPSTIIHLLEQLRQDLSPILRTNSILKSNFEEQCIHITQKSDTEDKESMHIAQKRVNDLSSYIVHSHMKHIITVVENQIYEESNFRSWTTKALKSIIDTSAKDEMDLKHFILKSKQDESELLRRIERLVTGQKIQSYHCQKKFETEVALKEKQAFEELECKKRTEEMAEVKQRVDHRNMLIELRKTQKKEKDDRERHTEELRAEKLKSLATLVPYYEAITSKKSDIHKLTKARMNDVYQYPSESDLLAFQQGDRKMTCFKPEKIFSDPKFRLAQQLHDKGIASSKYSLAVVKTLIPRKTERTTGIEPY